MLDIKEIYEIFKTCPRITIDSRHCPKDSIFVALRGDNTDGNLFAAKALENGSRYAIVDRKEIAVDDRYIVVDDTLTTLQDLARYHRHQWQNDYQRTHSSSIIAKIRYSVYREKLQQPYRSASDATTA